MKNEIEIRLAQTKDAKRLAEFNIAMALETENLTLSPGAVLKGVKTLLQHPQHGFYAVAEIGNEVQGCLMVTKEWSDWRNGMYWWVQSVYVLKTYRRHGVFRNLYDYIRKKADEEGGTCGFRLYVERNNKTAQDTYRAMGMAETDYLIFEKLYE